MIAKYHTSRGRVSIDPCRAVLVTPVGDGGSRKSLLAGGRCWGNIVASDGVLLRFQGPRRRIRVNWAEPVRFAANLHRD